MQALGHDESVEHAHDEGHRAPQPKRPGNNLDIQHDRLSSVLMTLRPVLVLLILVRWPARLFTAATATVTAVAEQMHTKERDNDHDSEPVLLQPFHDTPPRSRLLRRSRAVTRAVWHRVRASPCVPDIGVVPG